MDFTKSEFKRKFSMSMYKNLKIKLGEMTFAKDFVNDTRGDLYPLVYKTDDCAEKVEGNFYLLSKGAVSRYICQFFPYANYELSAEITEGNIGFEFVFPELKALIEVADGKLKYACGDLRETVDLPECIKQELTLIAACRPRAFDVYFKHNGKAEFFHTFKDGKLAESNKYSVFSNAYAVLNASGNVKIKEVCSYIDNGISIADIRPIRYENGDVMLEHGRIYLTASIRMQEEMFQGVFSWIPSTAEFELTGALFYDSGDGKWCGDVAASVLYHRREARWYLWVCSFAHDHILGHSVFEGDLRFGVNVVDIELMPKADEKSVAFDFVGFEGDEDPDFFYDEKKSGWLMAICRIDPDTKQYRYYFFESQSPFDGYKYIGRGLAGAETGGSFVKLNSEQFFICGNAYNKKSDYRIYSKSGMQNPVFNYPDGGFRGWGTLIPVKSGSRTRYYWLTFDRHNGSSYSWSYGNLYCFEI